MHALRRYRCSAWLYLGLALTGNAIAEQPASEQRIIVKWKTNQGRSQAQAFAETSDRVRVLAGVELQSGRQIDSRREVVRFDKELSIVGFRAALETLRTQANVEYAVTDERRHALLVPNDSNFSGQWYLQSTEPAAINAQATWDVANVTAQSANVTVAVIDTGKLDHPDLATKYFTGYDFVSGETGGTFLTANDDDGRDSDPSDPGDWIDEDDLQKTLFEDCDESPSSWHGTRVGGIIGAIPNNGVGITGTGWNAKLLPVRAIGKCGGWDSDILAATEWAAGLSVAGAPANAHPAKIINLSLGGSGTCNAAYADTVGRVRNAGALIVASAGNDGGPVNAPANCSGVIGVAGLRNAGTKVGFSSLGSGVAIAAPAGNCVNTSGACLFSIDTTSNTGTTTPGTNSYTDQYSYNVGTSFSAPIVSGTLALMFAANPGLSAEMAQSRLLASATAFPATANLENCHVPAGSDDLQESECNCTTSTCGTGMVNALKAAQFATQSLVAFIRGASTAGVNQQIVLDGTGSSTLGTGPLSYAWSATSGTLSSPSTTSTIFTAPATAGTSIVTLTVSDGVNTPATHDFTITTYSEPSVAIAGATTATGGLSITLIATATTADSTPATYVWSVIAGSATLSGANQADVTAILPNNAQTLTLRVTATDAYGNTASADHTVTVSGTLLGGGTGSSTTAPTSSDSGGGGVFTWLGLMALGLLALRRHSSRDFRRAMN